MENKIQEARKNTAKAIEGFTESLNKFTENQSIECLVELFSEH